MNGENMGGHNTIAELARNAVAWLLTWCGHLFSDTNLSRWALIMSIIYSAVNVWVMLDRRKRHGNTEH